VSGFPLLIAPEGIEILYLFASLKEVIRLLIAPEGIEIATSLASGVTRETFNRTRRN